jgi:3-methylcrotonyl-CoA carboxylase alpha subunit
VRIDSGVIEGDEVSIYYDPMIAKLIVWGSDRKRALARLQRALGDYRIGGVSTNVGFLYNLASSRAFRAGEVNTGFIDQHSDEIFRRRPLDIDYAAPLAAAALMRRRAEQARRAAERSWEPSSPWYSTCAWGLSEPPLQVQVQGQQLSVAVAEAVDLTPVQSIITAAGFDLVTRDGFFRCAEVPPDFGCDRAAATPESFNAPMNGTLISLLCEPGAAVKGGDTLLVMEAMKMEHAMVAPYDGAVSEFYFTEGDRVEGGATLLMFEPTE